MLLCPPFFFATLIAQNTQNPCHAHEVMMRQIAADPTLQKRVEANERFTNAFANRVQTRGGKQIIIPTVVHVLSASVSDAQVISQIDALNRDFNKLNSDLSKVPTEFSNLVADCEIKFQLAARTPENDPTNGIIRHTSSRTEWGGQDDVKNPLKGGFAPWNSSKYLNIYVCPIGNGVLGYASFPGTPEDLDGVVIDPTVFGTIGTARRPFNLGRTCVHEVAHWLNLYHIWGDSACGDDHCSDTPAQKEAHYGDPTAAIYSNCGAIKTRDMAMNYMDYVNDASMMMFTNGQKLRMQATLNGIRASILTSDGCVMPVQYGCKIKNTVFSELKTTAATLSWDANFGTKTYTIEFKKMGATNWKSITCTSSTYTFSNLSANENYTVRLKSDCSTAEFSEELNFSTRPMETGTDYSFQIYPNPVNDEVNFFFDTKKEGNVSIQVFDRNGKMVLKTAKSIGLDTPSVSIDLSGLSNGIYLVKAEQNGQIITKQLIKN